MIVGRSVAVKGLVLAVLAVLVLRLFYLQVIDDKYKGFAMRNVQRYEVQYPPRGEVYDRSGEFLVQSKEVYDLVAVPKDLTEFDTALMSSITGVPVEKIRAEIAKARHYSRFVPSVIIKQLPKDIKLRLEERGFPGFYTVFRTIRSYPRKIAGNLLGYVGEVGERDIAADPYYKSGDYIGKSGIEQVYEDVLRGEKGVKITMVDARGVSHGSLEGGIYDTLPQPGSYITCTISAELQAFAEELLEGKVGSVVAIEPSTGEVLVMASSPSYDPDQLVGRERGNNYMKLLEDKRHPLWNRAVMAYYPPGSTFKLVNGLIGQQEGVITPQTRFVCHNGFPIGRGVKCHSHSSPLNLVQAVQTSCNSYFCFAYRAVIDNRKYGSVKKGYDVWADYVRSFGFGRRLESDFTNELNGNVPSAEYYNKAYRGSWNSLTVISLSIGQGELGCTPLQMANLAAIVANRGYYYIPHVVREIEGVGKLDERFYERRYTKVDTKYFDPIVEGMYRAVNEPGGTAYWRGRIEGVDMCGKTGTAQNPHGKDHSTFLGFAPMNDPKIAISVYIEHGGFGAAAAVPIASLVTEKYLTDTIRRPELVQQIKEMKINYPVYEK